MPSSSVLLCAYVTERKWSSLVSLLLRALVPCEGPQPHYLINPNYLPKALSPDTITWRWMFQHMSWGEVGDTVQSIADSVALMIIFQEALFYYFFKSVYSFSHSFLFLGFWPLLITLIILTYLLTFLFQITILSFQIWGGGMLIFLYVGCVCWFSLVVDFYFNF